MAEGLVIGSRGSRLALWQAQWVQARLREIHPGLAVRIEVIKTKGDKILDVPLAKIGDKGLFTKELEQAILRREVDLAVHSMKDLPTRLEPGLAIGAAGPREDPRDAFLSADGRRLADLRDGETIGTSSLRRRAQLLSRRPGLRVLDLRGNVDTRARKVRDGIYAGAVMALAGLRRLGLEDWVTEVFDPEFILPAVAQGVLAIEYREDDRRTAEILAPLDDADAGHCAACERAFLGRLEGGCQVPVAALATTDGDGLLFRGFVSDLDGRRVFRETRRFARATEPGEVGSAVAQTLLERGAGAVLEEIFARARSEGR